MFDNQRNKRDEESRTLTRDEITMVQDALDAAIDSFVSSLDVEGKTVISEMLIDMSASFKFTYLLTPASIKRMVETYMSRDPWRDAIEDMSARFLTHLDNVDLIHDRLAETIAYGCSAHSESRLLPRALVEETVNFKNAFDTLSGENWLLFIASVTTYYNTYRLSNFIERNKNRG